jgi:hypothetical protein
LARILLKIVRRVGLFPASRPWLRVSLVTACLYAPHPHQQQLIRGTDYNVDPAGHQVLHSGDATIRHERKIRPGFFLKQGGYQAQTHRGDSRKRLVGIGLQPGHQFGPRG